MDVAGRDIWIVDALGGNLGVIHSPDGGITWRREQLPGIREGSDPLSISAFDSLVAWTAANSEGNRCADAVLPANSDDCKSESLCAIKKHYLFPTKVNQCLKEKCF